MSESAFSKSKLWTNIVGGVICYILFAYELYACLLSDSCVTSSLLFLFLAVNCTFRVFSYARLNALKKRMEDDNQFIIAERRQGIINTIFSNASAVVWFLIVLIRNLIIKGPVLFDALFVFFAICFSVILVQTVQNLNRFDRL